MEPVSWDYWAIWKGIERSSQVLQTTTVKATYKAEDIKALKAKLPHPSTLKGSAFLLYPRAGKHRRNWHPRVLFLDVNKDSLCGKQKLAVSVKNLQCVFDIPASLPGISSRYIYKGSEGSLQGCVCRTACKALKGKSVWTEGLLCQL